MIASYGSLFVENLFAGMLVAVISTLLIAGMFVTVFIVSMLAIPYTAVHYVKTRVTNRYHVETPRAKVHRL